MKLLGALCVMLWAASPAAACRLALLLALDISSSVDMAEDRLQRQGLAWALQQPDVQAALLANPSAPVALSVFEWSGRYQQDVLLDWTFLEDVTDVEAAAARIAGSKRRYSEFPTAVGFALGFAARRLESAPTCARQVLDVSGDGVNNEGFAPVHAYAAFPFGNTVVNGLAIQGGGDSAEDDSALVTFYRTELIRGPSAFVEVASNYTDFARVMRRKLLREIGAPLLGALPGPRPKRGG